MAEAPKRIQLRRTKGWRLPAGAVNVARPSRWGNWYVVGTASEYRHGNYGLGDDLVVWTIDKWGERTAQKWAGFADRLEAVTFAVDLYRRALEATYVDVDGPVHREHYLKGLAGHDLACWCPPGPCHADVLLSLANPGWRP